MKKLINIIRLVTCHICHGMGTIEINGGNDTVECPKCKGKCYL